MMEPVFGKGTQFKLWAGPERVDVRVYRHDGEGYFAWEDVRTLQYTAGGLIMFETVYLGHLVRVMVPATSVMDILYFRREDVDHDNGN